MRLHGTVRRMGRPVEGAYVRLLGPSGDFTAELRTDESGTFLFYPSEGTWTLLGIAAGGHRIERRVELTAGRTLEVDLEI